MTLSGGRQLDRTSALGHRVKEGESTPASNALLATRLEVDGDCGVLVRRVRPSLRQQRRPPVPQLHHCLDRPLRSTAQALDVKCSTGGTTCKEL